MPGSANRSAPVEILALFLRLGLTAFGGPAAHIVLMEREAVERRRWMSRAEFLDLVGACNLLPGPGSTQVAMALGYSRGGWLGLLIAGVCFILPASLATLALAWAYVRFGGFASGTGTALRSQAGDGRHHRSGSLEAGPDGLSPLAAGAWRALAALRPLAGVCAPIAVLLAAGGLALLAAWQRSRSSTAMGLAGLPLRPESAQRGR